MLLYRLIKLRNLQGFHRQILIDHIGFCCKFWMFEKSDMEKLKIVMQHCCSIWIEKQNIIWILRKLFCIHFFVACKAFNCQGFNSNFLRMNLLQNHSEEENNLDLAETFFVPSKFSLRVLIRTFSE